MKNNKVLISIIVTLIIIIAVLLIKVKNPYVVYDSPYPSPQTPNPTPDPTPSPTPSPNPSPSPSPAPCNITSSGSLESQYDSYKCQFSLKHSTYYNALTAFKSTTDSHMEVTKIDFYVPGKLPREDGNPYFIGRGTIDYNANSCVVGYMNLVTGVTESHRDVCYIRD